MSSAPIILVPGFWLGAWAWDEVAAALRADGHDVTALTLPGLEETDDRSAVSLEDHVAAIVAAIRASNAPVVLALHSARGFSGYAATDRVPERVAAVVYVDSAPGISPLDPSFVGAEKPLAWDEIEAEENLDGLSEAQKETFRERAVPEPGGILRDVVPLSNDARLDIPSTMICTSYPAKGIQDYAREQNPSWLAGLAELHDITWLDVPTSHWPMWSRPDDIVQILSDVARKHAGN